METLSYLFYITKLNFPLTPNAPPTCAEGKQNKKKKILHFYIIPWGRIKRILDNDQTTCIICNFAKLC